MGITEVQIIGAEADGIAKIENISKHRAVGAPSIPVAACVGTTMSQRCALLCSG